MSAVPESAAMWRRLVAIHRPTASPLPLPRPQLLLLLFLTGTVMAISPIGREIDLAFHLEPVRRSDGLVFTVLADGFDRLASQAVAGTALGLVALWLACTRRSLGPLLVAALTEAMFFATGLVKVVLAKSATPLGPPMWWDQGFLEHGKFSMAYPSGHATESVLLFGATFLLLRLYGPAWTHTQWRRVASIWCVLVAQTVLVSWLLGRHWVSDLAAGLVFGLFCLSLVTRATERGYVQALDAMLRTAGGATARSVLVTARRRGPRGLPAERTPNPRP